MVRTCLLEKVHLCQKNRTAITVVLSKITIFDLVLASAFQFLAAVL